MSRSGYSDDLEPLELGRWRGQVASAVRGKRGQAFLKELLSVLDSMPEKRLVANEFENGNDVCALGSIARARGLQMDQLDPDDTWEIGDKFCIANQLAREIMDLNDDYWNETPEERFTRMRAWVISKITP